MPLGDLEENEDGEVAIQKAQFEFLGDLLRQSTNSLISSIFG
jgi:hypothetical protein